MSYLPHQDITDGPNSAIDATKPTAEDSSVVPKPRCPWPVHEWPPQVKSVRVHDQRLIVYRTDSPFLSYFDIDASGHPPDTRWTRAEALASQMLDKPDKEGAWAIYKKRTGKLGTVVFFDDLSILKDSAKENTSFVICDHLKNEYHVYDYRFYYMGPLPEGEVQS